MNKNLKKYKQTKKNIKKNVMTGGTSDTNANVTQLGYNKPKKKGFLHKIKTLFTRKNRKENNSLKNKTTTQPASHQPASHQYKNQNNVRAENEFVKNYLKTNSANFENLLPFVKEQRYKDARQIYRQQHAQLSTQNKQKNTRSPLEPIEVKKEGFFKRLFRRTKKNKNTRNTLYGNL